MTVKLLTEHNLEFLSLKGCCTGSSESMLAKMSHCWKSYDAAQILFNFLHTEINDNIPSNNVSVYSMQK